LEIPEESKALAAAEEPIEYSRVALTRSGRYFR
jgi:hypothetical protein